MKVVTRKLWKVPVSKDKAYSPFRRSSRLVEVLEQGSKVIHRQRVAGDEHADYAVEGGWLVERTYPAITKALADLRVRERANAKKHAAIERSAQFRTVLETLDATDRQEDCGLVAWTCRAPKKREHARWMKLVDQAGGAATYRPDGFISSFRIVAGSAVRFARYFLLQVAEPDKLVPALVALDEDSRISLPWIGSRGGFELRLAAPPTNVARHAKALAQALGYPEREIANGLRAGTWTHSVMVS